MLHDEQTEGVQIEQSCKLVELPTGGPDTYRFQGIALDGSCSPADKLHKVGRQLDSSSGVHNGGVIICGEICGDHGLICVSAGSSDSRDHNLVAPRTSSASEKPRPLRDLT